MKKRNIYQNQSQELFSFFENIDKTSKMMCIPMDYAKKQRENLQASTDRLDLMGIASMLLSRRANVCPAQSGIYKNLRTIVRHRKKLVKTKTEVKNRIYTFVDQLFHGFLDETKSGIRPFSKSSLYLMSDRFSAHQINCRKFTPLTKALKRCGINHPDKAAAKLQGYSEKAFSAPRQHMHFLVILHDFLYCEPDPQCLG